MDHTSLICPICEKSDAIRCKDDPRFYRDGRLTAICFHGHGNGFPVTFDAETGAAIQHKALEPFEALYRVLEAGGARGFGPAFLADHCGIYQVTKAALEAVAVPFPSMQDLQAAEDQGAVIMAAPLYDGAAMVGLELRMLEVSQQKVTKWTKTLGATGIYISNPQLQPRAVVDFEGIWDAVSAAWDAFNHDALDYAFTSIKAGTRADLVVRTHEAHFPGVPVLIITDQDGAGKGARRRLRKAGTLAILPGAGLAKDYRAADPKIRYEALLTGIEQALDHGATDPNAESGTDKIAHRALDGALRAKQSGARDLEAWRFGQRCAGICRAPTGGKRFFSIRASIHGRTPVAEGLYDFEAVQAHRSLFDIRRDHPNLASVIDAGPTENPMSPEWKPPIFVEDGRHWSEIPADQRKAYACSRGWEPWNGKDVGPFDEDDLRDALGQVVGAYGYTITPGVPSSDVGYRVFIFALATSLCALRAEELWQQEQPTGFLPWLWAYGEPATGKGTVAKIIAAMVSGQTRTYGSQRFGGEKEASWLTESVIHLPVAFKDELDQFMDRTALEDLKTFIAGEALQKRKAYGTDMTISPRPVVFATNELKVNSDDVATKERIILLQLDKNKVAPDHVRNNAFETFRAWFQEEGCEALHRVGIHFYKEFRKVSFQKSRWTRSAMFDSAIEIVCQQLGRDPTAVMDPSNASKEAAILHGSPWYRSLSDFVQHDLVPGQTPQQALAVDVWGLNPGNDSDMKKLRRYLGSFGDAAREAGGHLQIGELYIKPSPFNAPAAKRIFIFEHCAEADIG